jgi:16S rRNA (guanine(966)-N(2))-methyltransferase RsmD
VIAGKFRSRKLKPVPGYDVRPTADRVRETLFNVLSAVGDLDDSVWLDLYAGTGAVGIEAISRGARMVYFAEASKRAAAVIRDNLAGLQITDGYELHERDAETAVRLLDSLKVVCDYVFLDPPYAKQKAYEDVLGFLSQSSVVGDTSVVIAEHDKHFDPGERFGALQRYRKLEQGDAVLSFYKLG